MASTLTNRFDINLSGNNSSYNLIFNSNGSTIKTESDTSRSNVGAITNVVSSPFENVDLPFQLSVAANNLERQMIIWPFILRDGRDMSNSMVATKVDYTDSYGIYSDGNTLRANHSHEINEGYQVVVKSIDGKSIYNSLNLRSGNAHLGLNVYPLSRMPSATVLAKDTHFEVLGTDSSTFMTVANVPQNGNILTDYYTTNVTYGSEIWTLNFYVDRFWTYVGTSNGLKLLRIMLAMRDVKIVIGNTTHQHPLWPTPDTTLIVRFHEPTTSVISEFKTHTHSSQL